jgi:hypothetical protein
MTSRMIPIVVRIETWRNRPSRRRITPKINISVLRSGGVMPEHTLVTHAGR